MITIQKLGAIRWVLLLIVAVFITSCGKPKNEKANKEYVVDTGRGYFYAPTLPAPLNRILPEDQAQPVSFDAARIVVMMDFGETRVVDAIGSNELAQISAIIGRIADIDRRVKSVELAWLDCPIAAKVKIRDYELFFVKDSQGKWEAVGSARVISDSFDSEGDASSKAVAKP